MLRLLHNRLFFYLLISFVCFSGCSSNDTSTGTISGKVRYKDNPVPGGTITFHITSEKGIKTAVGILQKDGSFEIKKAAVGSAKVTVETDTVNPGEQQAQSSSNYVEIPKQYNSVETSGLTMDIKQGENKKTFELK